MGQKAEDIKAIAQLRKAVMPLIELMRSESNNEITQRIEGLEKSVETLVNKGISVKVDAPEIKIEDLTSLNDSLQKLADSKLNKSADPNLLTEYKPHDQKSTDTAKYYGFVRADGSWYIMRDVGETQRYTAGSSDYSTNWDKCQKLKYKYIHEVM